MPWHTYLLKTQWCPASSAILQSLSDTATNWSNYISDCFSLGGNNVLKISTRLNGMKKLGKEWSSSSYEVQLNNS